MVGIIFFVINNIVEATGREEEELQNSAEIFSGRTTERTLRGNIALYVENYVC